MNQQMQYFDIENPPHQKKKKHKNHSKSSSSSSSDSSLSIGSDRIGFIRKVYGILSVQLAFTVVFCLASYSSTGMQKFQVQNIGLFYLCLILGVIVEISIICCQSVARQVPQNYIALGLFTFCQGYVVSTICSQVYLYFNQNGALLVLIAAILTLGVTVALTLYALTTSSDFTMMGGSLFIFGIVLMLFGLFISFVNCPALHLLYACLGAILFGFYLIYDTQLIAGGKREMLDIDDYIIGALMLYVDIITLFLQLLQILVQLFGERKD